MSQDLVPLFVFKDPDSEETKFAGAVVTVKEETYKASSFIANIAKEIQPDILSIIKGEKMGELTIAAYVLLESLYRIGMTKTAAALMNDSASLFHSALCTAIGMRAGMIVPEGAEFETTTSNSDSSVRNTTENEDRKSNENTSS